jgi:deoxyribodipyrimidine photolyase-related protein
MSVFYVLPNQLFGKDVSPIWKGRYKEIVVWEHPMFFTKYKFNKKKLVLHRASMRLYAKDLKDRIDSKVTYVEFHRKHTPPSDCVLYDPVNDVNGFEHATILESPNFLVTKEDMRKIWSEKKSKDSMRFTSYFYPRIKEIVGFLKGVPSKDKENRERYDGSVAIPPLPKQSAGVSTELQEAESYVEKHFSRNPGTLRDDFVYPVTTKQARAWLRDFVKRRLSSFGAFQDAVVERESWMFHSVLSSSINIGLLNPSEILEALKDVRDVPMNSLEGYVRQLIWREYQRYCYIYLRDTLMKRNRFDTRNELTEAWYTGSTGVYPVDASIEKAFRTGYLHHIERLMIVGNFMLLSEIRREDGFRWFMEFAIDSYEWVMYQNVYDMVFFSSGGRTTHKAYISGSPYVLRMTDYPKGEWTKTWDEKYKAFKNNFFKNLRV